MTSHESSPAAPRAHGMSKTAIWVAAARAVGAREPDARVRNPDHLAEPLLGDPARLALRHPIVDALHVGYEDALQDMEVASMVRAMIERTRFIDAALERAVAAGATQVLIPGAGFDSHAYRCRSLLAAVRVFEVDRPATLAFKRRRVDEAVGGAPPNVTYMPLDLAHDELPDALARYGYDVSQRTFVIMEGLTMYVPEESLRALFRFVAAHAAGSSVVFDFATRSMIEGLQRLDLASMPPAARPTFERFFEITKDEPWVFGFSVGGEQEWLAEAGLELGELLRVGSDESVRRYLTRADGSTVGGAGHAKAEALRRAVYDAAVAQASPEQRQQIEERLREQEKHNAYRIAEAAVA